MAARQQRYHIRVLSQLQNAKKFIRLSNIFQQSFFKVKIEKLRYSKVTVFYSISYGDASHVTFFTLSIGVSAAQSGLCVMHSIDSNMAHGSHSCSHTDLPCNMGNKAIKVYFRY